MIKTVFLMRSATWHNFNVNLLNCGMNIQIQKIHDKSSYWHKNDNTSSILTKQLCLLKITWPKKVIPTKSYSLAMLYLHHTKYLNHAQPRWQAKQLFHTFDIFRTFSIFTQYMSVSHGHSTYRWNRMVVVEKTKKEKIVSHQLGVPTGYGDAHQ